MHAGVTAVQIQGTDAGATHWAQIAEPYGVLAKLSSSPVVGLNRAAGGPGPAGSVDCPVVAGLGWE